MNEPIIFLDFDGVIVTSESCARGSYTKNADAMIDPVLVRRLQGVCDATGAVVVISSSWRLGRHEHMLPRWLRAKGLTAEVIGCTPQIRAGEAGSASFYPSPRGAEILAWLWTASRTGRDVSRFVILDDEPDAGFGNAERFVRCSLADGLTEERAAEAVRILEGRKP